MTLIFLEHEQKSSAYLHTLVLPTLAPQKKKKKTRCPLLEGKRETKKITDDSKRNLRLD